MWTSAEKANTTAQRMPLVRTPTPHSSASVTTDFWGTGSAVRVSWLQEITLSCNPSLSWPSNYCAGPTHLSNCDAFPVTMSILNSQMWTSVKKTNTTAQRMPLVRTPTARSSASVTKDIRGTAWTVHVKVSVQMIAGGERCQYTLVRQKKKSCPAIAPVLSPNGPSLLPKPTP